MLSHLKIPSSDILSNKDSSTISQEEINKIRNRYEQEEQRLKALEDIENHQKRMKNQSENKSNNNKNPLPAGLPPSFAAPTLNPIKKPDSSSYDNKNSIPNGRIYNPAFSHYTERKKKELLDQARKQIQDQKQNWTKDEQELFNNQNKKNKEEQQQTSSTPNGANVEEQQQQQTSSASIDVNIEEQQLQQPMECSREHPIEPAQEYAEAQEKYKDLNYQNIREIFSNYPKLKAELVEGLKTLNIPYSEHIWFCPDTKKSYDSSTDLIDERINQFPTEELIIGAYRRQIELLAMRNKERDSFHTPTICKDCLNACIRHRDILLDAARKIKYVRSHYGNKFTATV